VIFASACQSIRTGRSLAGAHTDATSGRASAAGKVAIDCINGEGASGEPVKAASIYTLTGTSALPGMMRSRTA
jgi:hypothetical protein